jgi:tRNA (guanine37-N1)-methyltransferase
MSGHHTQIAQWRRQQSLALTAQSRPELLEKARDQGGLTPQDEIFLTAMQATKAKSGP